MSMTNQEILDSAPEGWTHVTDGTYLQFTGIWLRYESGCPEITSCKEWVSDIDINDCENIRSRADIERIVELENTLHERTINASKRIIELENKLEKAKEFSAFQSEVVANSEKEIEQKDKHIVELERDMAQTMMCIEECTERLRKKDAIKQINGG